MGGENMEWQSARKKPITVGFREVKPDETGVETLEGYRPCNPEEHYIIVGVFGEEYPIQKDIFEETYDVVKEIESIEITDPKVLEKITLSRGMEWAGEHIYRKYSRMVKSIFEELEIIHGLDFKKQQWRLDEVDGKDMLIYVRELHK